MRNLILTSISIVFLSCLLQSQSLKKPPDFSIPQGTAIQHKKLSKPKYIPSNLDSRSFGAVKIKYQSISSDALKKLRKDISVQEINDEGYPTRFRCSAIQQNPNEAKSEYWSKKLIELLRLGPQTGIQFKIKSEVTENSGIIHLKYDQLFDGMPVLDAEYFVHIYNDQSAMAHGSIHQPTQALQSKLNEAEAFVEAKKYLDSKGIHCITPTNKSASWIKMGLQDITLGYWKNPGGEVWHLVYRMDIFPNAMSRWMVWVDALTGEILKASPNQCMLHNHDESSHLMEGTNPPDPQTAEKANALDLFNITRSIDVWREGSVVYLIDASRPMFKANQFKLDDPVGAIWTLDGLNSNPNNIRVDQIKSSNNTWAKNAVSAHYNAGLAFEYYTNTHSRNSINGLGGSIISIINVIDENGGGLDNAFWNGEAMFYGNGAQAFNPLARGLDVAGHEMSHGVIQSTANLVYEGESGAINESFADVFGAMIDRNDWKIGEDVVKLSAFPSGALRDMSDPHNGAQTNDFGRWQPRHVNEQYLGNQDNGGVHINSGIPNFAFYLFVQELAIGSNEEQAKKTAEKIYYRSLNLYLTRSSNFKDLRSAVEQACMDLHGNNSSVHNAAKKVFAQVGIGTSSNPGGGNYQKDLPVNPGKEFVVCTDDFNEGIYLIDIGNSNVSQLSLQSIKSKPSISDDGSEIYYVGDDSKLYALYFNKTRGQYEEFILDSDPIYRNVSISKNGALLSVLFDQEENKIHVYEFSKDIWKIFTLTNPTTSSGVATSNVRYADFMDFEPSGQLLMYDCLSKLEREGGGSYQYWDIGFLRVWDLVAKTFGDGHIEKLFSNIPDNTSVGNPVYAKNSPYIMAFDYLEESIFGSTFSILAANIETGELGEVAINRDDTGYPSYSVKDDVLLYNGVDNTSTESLKFKTLAANKIQGNGPEELFISGARWGNWFANGKRSLVKSNDEDKLLGIKVSPNPFTNHIFIEIESKSEQEMNCEIYSATGQPVNNYKVKLTNGKNGLRLILKELPQGIYYLKIKTQEGESGFTLCKLED